MLEFIAFLTSKEKEILELLYKAEFSVEENTPLCLLGDKFFGFYKKRQRTVVICTENAMKKGGYYLPKSGRESDYDPTAIYIRRALRHEAVHVAQSCKQGNILDPVKARKMKLHPYKKKAFKSSTMVSGNKENEFEAYWLEDKPRIVKNALQKYCL